MKTLREEIEAYIEFLDNKIDKYIAEALEVQNDKDYWNFYNGKIASTYRSMYDLINILDKIDEISTK